MIIETLFVIEVVVIIVAINEIVIGTLLAGVIAVAIVAQILLLFLCYISWPLAVIVVKEIAATEEGDPFNFKVVITSNLVAVSIAVVIATWVSLISLKVNQSSAVVAITK